MKGEGGGAQQLRHLTSPLMTKIVDRNHRLKQAILIVLLKIICKSIVNKICKIFRIPPMMETDNGYKHLLMGTAR